MAELVVRSVAGLRVWRVGYRPEPWAWVGWEWATNGVFGGRWDDSHGNFRTLYTSDSLLNCLIELLASLRREAATAEAMESIEVDDDDARDYPTAPAGVVPAAWPSQRAVGIATMTARFGVITAAESLAALYPHFIGLTKRLDLHDFDAAALKDPRARELTQAVAHHLYSTRSDLDGIQFESRHGDDLTMWALFERTETDLDQQLTDRDQWPLTRDNPALRTAMSHLGLRWDDQPPDTDVGEPPMPLPVVQMSDDEVVELAELAELGPDTPLGSAVLWWNAIDDPDYFATALARLTVDPAEWHGFTEARQTLSPLSVAHNAMAAPDRPHDVAYIKFLDTNNQSVRAFAAAPLTDVWILTLVKTGPIWQVWKLTHNSYPVPPDPSPGHQS